MLVSSRIHSHTDFLPFHLAPMDGRLQPYRLRCGVLVYAQCMQRIILDYLSTYGQHMVLVYKIEW